MNKDMTDIKEEIFDNNLTLFQVLDDNQVTDIVNIQSQLSQQGQLIQENKQQLDGLARVVDTNQANNARTFVEINTTLVEYQEQFNKIDAKFVDVQETFESINSDLAQITTDIQYLLATVSDLETTVGGLDYQFEGIQQDINDLKQQTSDNLEAIVALRDNVTLDLQNLDNKITALNTRVVALESKVYTGNIQNGVVYKFRFKHSSETNYRTFDVIFDLANGKFGNIMNGTTLQGGTCSITFNKVFNIDPPCDGLPIPLCTWLNATGRISSSNVFWIVQESAGVYVTLP